jgi:hypothetical protein
MPVLAIRCPACGSAATDRGHWVSCDDVWCERSEDEQRARQMWYLWKPPVGWKGGMRRWRLWDGQDNE